MYASSAFSSFAAKNRPGLHGDNNPSGSSDERGGKGNSPGVLSVAEGDEVNGGVHELVPQALAFALAHLLVTVRVEHLCVRVFRVVVVHRARSCDEHGTLRDERPVA